MGAGEGLATFVDAGRGSSEAPRAKRIHGGDRCKKGQISCLSHRTHPPQRSLFRGEGGRGTGVRGELCPAWLGFPNPQP